MKFILFLSIFILAASGSVFALSRRDIGNDSTSQKEENTPLTEKQNLMENTLTITGKVQIYGNEPNTFVGIISEDGVEYSVYPQSEEEKLRAFQGNLLEFTVILLEEGRGYGSLFLRGGTVTPVSWKIIQ